MGGPPLKSCPGLAPPRFFHAGKLMCLLLMRNIGLFQMGVTELDKNAECALLSTRQGEWCL